LTTSTATSTPGQRTREIRPGIMTKLKPELFGTDQARHLLSRAGFGGTAEQIDALVELGHENAVDYLLDVKEIDTPRVDADDFDQHIMYPPTREQREMYRRARQRGDEDALSQQRLARQKRQRDDRRQMRSIQRWWLTRMIETPRPLEEKMTLFWHGHFATNYRTIENSYHMFRQNQLFRKHSLGNFGELMLQIIRDPAMLAYLDNNDSKKGKPNENLARELMELFSLGVGHYTENDIKEGARALTGYTFNDDEFVFNERNHDGGAKRVLGKSGNLDGDDFVMAILSQRAVSKYMAWKFYRFFAADTAYEPRDRDRFHDKAVRDTSASLLRHRYWIKPVLKRLFMSEHFYSSVVVRQQIKSPTELVVGSTRSLLTPVRDLSVLLDAMALMGQNLFFPPSVAGWDGGRSWINTSTLFVRQNVLAYLLTGKKPQGYDGSSDTRRFDSMLLLQSLQQHNPKALTDITASVNHLLTITLGEPTPFATETLTEFVNDHGGKLTTPLVTALLLLITAMPEYQLN